MYSHCNSSLYEVQCRLISHYINQQFNMIIKHIGNEIIIHRQLIREGDNHIGLNDNQSGEVDNLFNNKCKPIKAENSWICLVTLYCRK